MTSERRVPQGASEAGKWHHLEFDFLISNYDIDWCKVDEVTLLRSLAIVVAYATANASPETLKEQPARMLPTNFRITQKDMVTDQALWEFIDEPE